MNKSLLNYTIVIEDAPDNLFEPIAGFDRVGEDFTKQSRAARSPRIDLRSDRTDLKNQK
jgi:hypothetical protein